jgi:NTE family protein
MTTAFALSGGGNLGPMQAGTVVALMEAGIEPDLLVGTSVGALNAAFLSTRPGVSGARELMAAWSAMRRRDVFRFDLVSVLAGFFGLRGHVVSAHQLRTSIRRLIQIDHIEQAPIPLAVTATDALTGDAVVLTGGDIVDALAASSAIPGLFPPVRIAGRWLVDGSLSANRPVLQAQALGADDVYVITTSTAPRIRPPRGAVAMAMNSVSLVTARSNQEQLVAANAHATAHGGRVFVVPSAEPTAPATFDFRKSAGLADTAYRRTVRWLLEEPSATTGRRDDRSVPPVSFLLESIAVEKSSPSTEVEADSQIGA